MNTPTNQKTSCANAATLKRYIDDQLDPHEEAELESHLDTCAECQRSLESAGGNAEWWSGIRGEFLDGAASAGNSSGDDPIGREVLSLLAPTDDPRMLGRIGHYEVQGVIGQGSAGVVLRALDPRLSRTVAIKVLAPAFVASSPARTRFEREAKAVAAVAHDHVVPIYAVDEHQGLPYIVMQYVSGSLRNRFQEAAPLTTREVTRIGLQIARALDAAHGQGIVHRDVKPANVLVEGSVDRIMVTDFGLASVAGDASMTFSGTIHGTPHYMSPEQARGESVDARSDLFSLGSLLYEACTGRPPFQAQTVFGVIRRVCETEPAPIREINPEIDEWLSLFIERLMEKDATARFQTADAVGAALAAELAYLQNPTGTARPERAWLPIPKPQSGTGRRGIPPIVLAGCAAFGLGALGYLALTNINDGDDRAPAAAVAVSPVDAHTFRNARHALSDVAGQPLSIRIAHGDVIVQAAETQGISVEMSAVINAETEEAAASIFDTHPIALEQADGRVILSGWLDDTEHWGSLRYTVTVPAGTDIDVEHAVGDLIIGAGAGAVNAEVENGNIDIGYAQGRVDAKATHGNVYLIKGCAGDARLVAVRGDASMSGVEGDGYAIASGGNVWLGRSPGNVGAQTSGGDILVDGVSGPVRAHATGGNVHLWVPQEPRETVKANASNGNVTLMVAENVNATIRASGQLDSIHAYEWETTEDDVGAIWASTTLNQGGTTIQLSSYSGSIDIQELGTSDGSLQSAMGQLGRSAPLPPQALPSASSPDSGSYASLGGSDLGGSGLGGSDSGLGGSGLGGSGLGGSGTGLGGSGLGGSGLGGSGLGGSGEAGSASGPISGDANSPLSDRAASIGSVQNSAPRPGVLTTVRIGDDDAGMDGYTIHLPENFSTAGEPYPILIFLQGAFGVGGPIERVNDWGLTRLLRDETSLETRRNQLLLDGFIVINPHIQRGGYDDHPEVVRQIIDDVVARHHGDRARVYLTGLSRGGHGSYGLAEALPGTFAAIAPIGGSCEHIEDWTRFEGTSVWISHNAADARVSFVNARRAIDGIESSLGVQFRAFDHLRVAGTDYLDHTYILTAAPTRSHDAWTEIYSHAEFYEWLLRHRLD